MGAAICMASSKRPTCLESWRPLSATTWERKVHPERQNSGRASDLREFTAARCMFGQRTDLAGQSNRLRGDIILVTRRLQGEYRGITGGLQGNGLLIYAYQIACQSPGRPQPVGGRGFRRRLSGNSSRPSARWRRSCVKSTGARGCGKAKQCVFWVTAAPTYTLFTPRPTRPPWLTARLQISPAPGRRPKSSWPAKMQALLAGRRSRRTPERS